MMSLPHNLPSTYVRLLSVPFFRDALSLPPPLSSFPPPPSFSLLLPPPLFWGQIRFHENRLSPERRSGRRAVERERENSTVTRDTGNTFCGSFKSLTSEFASATCWLVTYVFVRDDDAGGTTTRRVLRSLPCTLELLLLHSTHCLLHQQPLRARALQPASAALPDVSAGERSSTALASTAVSVCQFVCRVIRFLDSLTKIGNFYHDKSTNRSRGGGLDLPMGMVHASTGVKFQITLALVHGQGGEAWADQTAAGLAGICWL